MTESNLPEDEIEKTIGGPSRRNGSADEPELEKARIDVLPQTEDVTAPPVYSPSSIKASDRKRLPKLKGQQAGVGKWLEVIVEKLDEANEKLDRVLAGQQADRVGLVQAGVRQYEQAMRAVNMETRRDLLRKAAQSLNEGREQVLRNLQATIQQGLRPQQWQDHLWKVVTVDKPNVDFRRHLAKHEMLIAESLYVLNLSTAYLFKSYREMKEERVALEVLDQFGEDCATLHKELFELHASFPATPVSDEILALGQIYGGGQKNASQVRKALVR